MVTKLFIGMCAASTTLAGTGSHPLKLNSTALISNPVRSAAARIVAHTVRAADSDAITVLFGKRCQCVDR